MADEPQVTLAHGEYIVAVAPQCCRGPGWSNQLLLVHISTNDGRLRTEYIQPGEQTREQLLLFRAAEAMHQTMLDTVTTKKA